MSEKKIKLNNDFKTHKFSSRTSQKIFLQLRKNTCNSCNGALNPNEAFFYQNNSGWSTSDIEEKIWIWFVCSECHHLCGLNYLGVPRNIELQLGGVN